MGRSILRHGGDVLYAPIHAPLPEVQMAVPDCPPVVGAALLGCDALGWTIVDAVLRDAASDTVDGLGLARAAEHSEATGPFCTGR